MKYKIRHQRVWCSSYEDVFPEKEKMESAIVGGLFAFASSIALLAVVSMLLK